MKVMGAITSYKMSVRRVLGADQFVLGPELCVPERWCLVVIPAPSTVLARKLELTLLLVMIDGICAT